MLLKNITGKIPFHLVKFILFLTRVIPLKFSYTLCTFIVFAGSRFKWKRKEIALDNLKIVFPEKTKKERNSILRESLRKILKCFFEFAYIINGKYTAEKILRMASATGLEYMDNLKEGKIVLIQNYQSHPAGIYINFFNKYVPSPAGPALLAKRAGVPIIPAYICRDKDNHHKITILPVIPLQHEDDPEKFIKMNTQILMLSMKSGKETGINRLRTILSTAYQSW
ncbi:MAG: hypothetical protein MUC93_06635 [Bacteroidales bacterium]|jgi:lauroyl/myristoyl acyltransferase|nr:hypothetical protein [Bacteroidales bacterium]